MKQRYYNEINMVHKLNCPYIIHIDEYFEDKERIYVVMEYCNGQSLMESINNKVKDSDRFTEKQIAWVINQIILALSYLHANNICHRDIKPENIMFMGGPPGKGLARVKIIDFGCARYFNKNEKMRGIYGTSNYVAPEMMLGNYDCKVDIFSVGVLLHAMMTLKLPFNGRTDHEILK